MDAFKRHGIGVGPDDFGTGCSSLRHLRRLPFDEIDRSLVLAIDGDPEALEIARAIVSLNLLAVAEATRGSARTAKHLRRR